MNQIHWLVQTSQFGGPFTPLDFHAIAVKARREALVHAVNFLNPCSEARSGLRERECGVHLVCLHDRQYANYDENRRLNFVVVRTLVVERRWLYHPWPIQKLFGGTGTAILNDGQVPNAAHSHASCGILPPCTGRLNEVVKDFGSVSRARCWLYKLSAGCSCGSDWLAARMFSEFSLSRNFAYKLVNGAIVLELAFQLLQSQLLRTCPCYFLCYSVQRLATADRMISHLFGKF